MNEKELKEKQAAMSKLKEGTKIKFTESGLKYEITKVFEGEIHDIKALQPLFEWIPNFYPVYRSIKLQNYKAIANEH